MEVQRRYDADLARVLGTVTDPTYLRARSAKYGGAGEPTVDRENGLIIVTVPRQLPLEHVPGPFRRFVGDGRILQVDRWSAPDGDAASGTWTTDTGHAPLDLRGEHRLLGDRGGCHYVVTATTQVRLPLAGRLVRLLEQHLGELIDSELQFLARWLEAK